jgi:hypothetical protein
MCMEVGSVSVCLEKSFHMRIAAKRECNESRIRICNPEELESKTLTGKQS